MCLADKHTNLIISHVCVRRFRSLSIAESNRLSTASKLSFNAVLLCGANAGALYSIVDVPFTIICVKLVVARVRDIRCAKILEDCGMVVASVLESIIIDDRIPITTMTINNSTSVKPLRFMLFMFRFPPSLIFVCLNAPCTLYLFRM